MPAGRLYIAFEDQERRGEIRVTQPVVPEYSAPPLTRERIEARTNEENPRGTRGGFYHLEKGFIRMSFENEGLKPDNQVKIEDDGKSRKISLGFRRL